MYNVLQCVLGAFSVSHTPIESSVKIVHIVQYRRANWSLNNSVHHRTVHELNLRIFLVVNFDGLLQITESGTSLGFVHMF